MCLSAYEMHTKFNAIQKEISQQIVSGSQT